MELKRQSKNKFMYVLKKALHELREIEGSLVSLNSNFEMSPFMASFNDEIKHEIFTLLFNEQLYKYLADTVEHKLGIGTPR